VASHAGLEPEKGASALGELARFVLFAEALADRALGTSVVPTLAKAGSRANVVPESAELTIDFRVWSAAEGERVASALGSYRSFDARVSVEVEGGLNRPPMEATRISMEMFGLASAIAARLGFPLPSARVGGASDGNLTAGAGVPTLDGLGPSAAARTRAPSTSSSTTCRGAARSSRRCSRKCPYERPRRDPGAPIDRRVPRDLRRLEGGLEVR